MDTNSIILRHRLGQSVCHQNLLHRRQTVISKRFLSRFKGLLSLGQTGQHCCPTMLLEILLIFLSSKQGGQTGQHCRAASFADGVKTVRQILFDKWFSKIWISIAERSRWKLTLNNNSVAFSTLWLNTHRSRTCT